MSNGFPINVTERARREADLYVAAYVATIKRGGSADHAKYQARQAVAEFRAFLVDEGYTDLAETED